MTDPRPPAHIEPYVRVLGQALALQFLLEFGGAELYLAKTPQGSSRAEELLGPEHFAALSQLGLPRRVPTAKPWLARVLKQEGLSHAEIARKLHVSDVSVRAYLADAGPKKWHYDPRQKSLL